MSAERPNGGQEPTGGTENLLFSARGISKVFDIRAVLSDVDMDLARGEIHALVGQNGSGKSTFIKILAGFHTPEPGGRLTLQGEEVPLPLSPSKSRRLGMSFMHQDLALIDSASVLENLRSLQFETGLLWKVSWKAERQRVVEMLARFGLSRIDLECLMRDLREVDRALIALLRAVSQLDPERGGVLVLDEPTAYLPEGERESLLAVIRQVSATGFAVLLVTHNLSEVVAVADRVSVLRDGKLVHCVDSRGLDESALTEMILGRRLDQVTSLHHVDGGQGDSLLSVSGLSGRTVSGVDFTVREGEVLGVTGLEGSGADEIPYLLFGAARADQGSIAVKSGEELPASALNPARARRLGFALLPGNRLRDGGSAEASVMENLTLNVQRRFFLRGWRRRALERDFAQATVEEYGVVPALPMAPFGSLSGGNQQKVLLAKWMATKPKLLLLHEPTAGVDVGARHEIFARINKNAGEGLTTVLVTGEFEHIASLCDRAIVMRHGRIAAVLSGDGLNEDRIAAEALSS